MDAFGQIGHKSSKYASKKTDLVLKTGVYGTFWKIRAKSSKYASKKLGLVLKMGVYGAFWKNRTQILKIRV